MKALEAQHPVAATDLEHQLERLGRRDDPVPGIFGPSSKLWEVNREAVLFLGGGRAGLLQLAHPAVAEAIRRHSDAHIDPMARFRRTFWNVFRMVFGDLDEAIRSARSVHRVHTHITGTFERDVGHYRAGDVYRANDAAALFWVHATLWDTSIDVFERVVRPLSDDEKDRYHQESLRFAQLFGLDPRRLPQSWVEFESYNRQMWTSDRLTVTPQAAEIAAGLFRPHHPLLAVAGPWLRTMTLGLLPDPVRRKFEPHLGASSDRVVRGSLWLLKKTLRVLPNRLRYIPHYQQALRRIEGRGGRDRVAEWLSALYIGKGRPASARLHKRS